MKWLLYVLAVLGVWTLVSCVVVPLIGRCIDRHADETGLTYAGKRPVVHVDPPVRRRTPPPDHRPGPHPLGPARRGRRLVGAPVGGPHPRHPRSTQPAAGTLRRKDDIDV